MSLGFSSMVVRNQSLWPRGETTLGASAEQQQVTGNRTTQKSGLRGALADLCSSWPLISDKYRYSSIRQFLHPFGKETDKQTNHDSNTNQSTARIISRHLKLVLTALRSGAEYAERTRAPDGDATRVPRSNMGARNAAEPCRP